MVVDFNLEKLIDSSFRIFILVFNEKTIDYLSPNIRRIFHINPSWLPRDFFRTLYSYVHPEDISKVILNVKQVQSKDINNEHIVFNYRLIHNDITYYIQCNLSSKIINNQKKIIAINSDITSAIKEKDDMLFYQNEIFNILTEKAPIGMWQIDPEGNLIWANKRFEEIFELPFERLKDKKFYAFIKKEYRISLIHQIEEAIETGKSNISKSFQIEIINYLDHYLKIEYEPIFNGKFQGYVGVIYDMNLEYKLLEKIDKLLPVQSATI